MASAAHIITDIEVAIRDLEAWENKYGDHGARTVISMYQRAIIAVRQAGLVHEQWARKPMP